MNFADAERIATAVLYEGYILYPYRNTSTKNVQRWNFGTLYPRDYAAAQRPVESYSMRTECLVKAEPRAEIHLRIRFLQLVRKDAATPQAWEQGLERTAELHSLPLSSMVAEPICHDFAFQLEAEHAQGQARTKTLCGRLHLQATPIQAGLYKMSLELQNLTPMSNAAGCARNDAMLEAFVSAHALLGVTGGEFVSLLDPPDAFREAVTACNNCGVFPVLVGDPDQRTMMLSSPIILYDYPQIAPESMGDFFDGTEMDEMLALRVLTLTEEEKREMRTVDDHARKILERTETLPQDFLMKVHGAIRGLRPVAENPASVDAVREQPE